MTRRQLLVLLRTPLIVVAAICASSVAPASAVAYSGATDWKTISAGDTQTCAIRSTGKLYCWGTDGTGSTVYPVSGYSDWISVSVGASHRCAIRGSGLLYCWGDDADGQLGNGSGGSTKLPTRIGSASDWKSVSAGATHTCGIRSGGVLQCWGSDAAGQLGNGSGGGTSSPVTVGSGTTWRAVSAGGSHTCAIGGAGALFCWGSDSDGQLGNGTAGSQTSPARIATSYTDWTKVTTGTNHTCAIRGSGRLYCWGDDAEGQVGNGDAGSPASPTAIAKTYADWKVVSAGDQHTCALRGGGTLYCWGSNANHQVSSGSQSIYKLPNKYSTMTDWTTTDAGARHSCALRGRIYCWGAQQAPSNGTPAGSAYPASLSAVGYLKAWKVTLPVDGSDAGPYADEVEQPQLATYRSLSYLHTNASNTAVVLRAPVAGAKTPGSVFTRTELRNMYPFDGVKAKNYNWTSGTHVLEVTEAFTHVPALVPNVVGVQIHDPDHEVLMIRLDGKRLYAQVRQLNGTYTEFDLNTAYALGTRFTVKVTANSTGITVNYNNGARVKTFAGRRPSSSIYWYYKAGCYLHSNTAKGESPNEFGEVLIYRLKVTHS